MTTLTLIPNEVNATGYTYSNALNNALSDVTDDDYGTIVAISGGTGNCYLGFEALPSDIVIDSVKAKVRAYYEKGVSNGFRMQVEYVSPSGYISSTTGIAGSVTGIPYETTDEITEIPIRENFNLNKLVGNRPVISVFNDNTENKVRIYGASITITYHHITNKVIYDDTTLIDLTSDTVTAANVLSGTEFHLPSGKKAIGTHVPLSIPAEATKSLTSTSKSMAFNNINSEPSFFVLMCTSSNGPMSVYYILFEDSKIIAYRCYKSSSNIAFSSISSTITFTYSNKVLTIKSTTYNFGKGTWKLYYL